MNENQLTPRSDQFDIKKGGIQTNKPLNWHHGGCTCIDFIFLNCRFIPVVTKEPFTKTLKCLARKIKVFEKTIMRYLLYPESTITRVWPLTPKSDTATWSFPKIDMQLVAN